jgi:hypothetical protein
MIQLNNGDTYISGNNFVKIGPNNIPNLTVDSNGARVEYGKNIIIPDSGGSYGLTNGSYIYNNGQTLNIEMRNGGDGRIQLKAGAKTASFDKNGMLDLTSSGKICFGPGKCISATTPNIMWSS